jgi:hypothetical protein
MGIETSEWTRYDPTIYTAPQAGYEFKQPWFEDYQRRLSASVFGAPGQYGGLIDQPLPIPVEGTAGLSPMEIMARQGAMGAGPYEPAYGTASQLMGEAAGGYRGSTGAFNPYTMISPYYDPYETDVVQDTLERMRRTSAREDIAGRAQDISSGAFGGSRGRLLAGERQAESERGILGALAGIRGQGFQRAQEAAMGDYGRRMSMLSGAAGGLGSIAGQVLGMGGQRQQELMSQLQMMNLLGGQGRDISQQRLSRLYQAALQKSQEPWERVMRGQALLAGLDPGRIYGGYTTESAKPEIKSEPTGLGETIKTATGLKQLWDMFFGSEGGYVEKPKKYNDGGIVSGLVPIQMQDGGDPEVEEMDIPEWVLEALESGDIRTRMAAIQWLQANQAGEAGKGVGGFFKRKNQEFIDRMARIAESDDPNAISKELEFMPPIGGITSLLRTGLPKQILSQIAPRITARTSVPPTAAKPVVTPKGGVIKGPIKEPVLQRPTSKAVRSTSRRPVGPYIPGGVQQVLREAEPPPSITQRAADVFKGKGTAARDILIGKPGQRNPFGKGQLGLYERAARFTKGATRVGAVVGIGALGLVVKDLLSGLNDEEKAEMLAKLEGLTEEQMAAVAEEQERLKKVKDKKDRSRALSRFVDLMYERPTSIGDLGIMYQQERLGTVPAETVAAQEAEELARMSGLPVETVMMMQYPQGAFFAREAAAKHQKIANAIVNYLIEQGVLDEVTAVERRATLLELPEESLEKIARELGVPLGDLAAPGATVLEPD